MAKPITIGCVAQISGTMTPFDGEIVQVLFEDAPDKNGYAVWVISEEFPNSAGFMTDRCYEHFLTRVDDDKELCTDWSDIMFTAGWVPDELVEVVEAV